MPFDMLHRIADLHRAGMSAQQVGGTGGASLDIKGVMHRTCRMVLWRIQGGEVEPVRLNFWTLRDIKSHRAKDGLNAFQGERHWVQTALPALATWQGHVQRLSLELRLQFGVGQCLAAAVQSRFNGL